MRLYSILGIMYTKVPEGRNWHPAFPHFVNYFLWTQYQKGAQPDIGNLDTPSDKDNAKPSSESGGNVNRKTGRWLKQEASTKAFNARM